ncbi:2-oxo acid dehydrogenase subunit E2 [Oceanisphaera arctica]|uniref:Dihydrolipoamide acetyltransferase component of pyruvate dehydrogenase complex n=1 Tax=Oceanisphaera arctica TaxID=641510 RepID=A0A2P5TQ40_9GAMM|nr:2-oxo acid dehydrogenase subunit E2 [Oceanisphaera arctica]PPL17849.1 dihydrolipoamide acetyltransferase [Oceanisphaera arctica]GHA23499.1 dihydrolipoamide acetyltransferase component of pyruvate dehydrogenase complex [Oceanisphaera arctica]
MKQDFYLPDIGEGIVECELVEWLVEEGERVIEDQAICDVMTDKALVQIPAMHSGIISRLYVAKGKMARVHAPLFEMEVTDTVDAEPSVEPVQAQPSETTLAHNRASAPDTPEQAMSASTERAPAPARPPATDAVNNSAKNAVDNNAGNNSGNNEKVLASPAVRRLAREQELDLSRIPGTGDKGRVYKEDIEAYLTERKKDQTTSPRPVESEKSVDSTKHTEPLTGIAAAMARQMTASLAIPQFTFCDELDLGELLRLKHRLKPIFAEQNIKLTLLPFFIKALSLALNDFPLLNSRLNAEATEVSYLPDHHIGVAVDTDAGLLVPVLRHCQRRSLLDLAVELERLTTAARAGRLTPVELQGATITLSNIGALGGVVSSPLVMPPQVAIAALGRLQRLPRFNEAGEVEGRDLMMVCWSADHRLIDGATLARFNRRWFRYLEQPERMLAQLS